MQACGDKRGSVAGSTRHYRAGEPLCGPCADARRAYGRRASAKYRQTEKYKLANAAYQEQTRARRREKAAARRRTDKYKEQNRVYMSRKRSLKKNYAHVKYTPHDLKLRMSMWARCWICGTDEWTHVDHVKPLSKGGADILANLRPACAACNLSKGSKWPYTIPRR